MHFPLYCLVLVLCIVTVLAVTTPAKTATECPVCQRVIKAAVDMGAKQGITSTKALEKYCAIATLEVEDQKFCYNIDTLGKDISRLLEMGADEYRVCKKVNSINPDFCRAKTVKSTKTGVQLNDRLKKGIIYE